MASHIFAMAIDAIVLIFRWRLSSYFFADYAATPPPPTADRRACFSGFHAFRRCFWQSRQHSIAPILSPLLSDYAIAMTEGFHGQRRR